MLSFECDYSEGCAPEILDALLKTNMEQLSGYGMDKYCESAKEKIRNAIGCPDAEIYFLNGGTMVNQLVINTMLEPYEGVISADTGHVNVHEAGAIEFTGHKVLGLPSHDGKLNAAEVCAFIETFYADGNHEHMAFPGMVYISHPTEYGTLYSKKELLDLADVCHRYQIPLYADGARLAYGVTSKETDVTIRDIAEITDVFYIGGTKCGALCGEALVFTKNNCPTRFITRIKQHGDLSAKGRLYGVQFDVLFTDDLYIRLGKHANEMAEKLKKLFADKGFKFYLDSPTNQQFFIIENELLQKIGERALYSFWEKYDDTHTVVRFATSWATKPGSIDELAGILDKLV